MSKYRFKTEEEFKRDGLWNVSRPKKWSPTMLKYLGKDIPDSLNKSCDKQEKFRHETWHIEPCDYVLKESVSQYTKGKWYGCKRWSSKMDFVKLTKAVGDQAYFIECINDGQYENKGENWWSFVTDSLFEADMSIVSPLLPDGHPDKIVAEEHKQEEKIDMQAIQEEAKRRFPIGCKFIPLGCTQTRTLIEDGCTYKISGLHIWAHNMCGSLYNGKWATLVSLPKIKKEIFYKGDYIVTLDVEDGYNCAKRNYCFKQRVDQTGICPAVDLKGSTGNGHGVMSFDKKGFLKDWRYATKEEAEEYERVGKPYDVTTLKSKEESIPEYVECIRSGTIDFTVNNIYNWPNPIDDKGKERHINNLDGSLWGFKPSTRQAYEAQFAAKKEEFKEEKFKVGDYCVKGNFIFIKVEKNPYKCNNYALNRRDKEYHAGNAHMKEYNSNPTRHATQGEKDWLDACIKAGKFVPNPKDTPIQTTEIDFGKLDLEDWLRETKKLNFSLEMLTLHIEYGRTCDYKKVYTKLECEEDSAESRAKYLYNLWNSKLKEEPIVEKGEEYEDPFNFSIIKKETFIDDVQSVDVTLRTKKKTIKF